MSHGGILAYLDACEQFSECEWLGISEDGDNGRDQSDFWSIDQVVPGELRDLGFSFHLRMLEGLPPETSLECWFRRVVRKMSNRKYAPVEAWVVLHAMAHAYAGKQAPSPFEFSMLVGMGIRARHYFELVIAARKTMPKDAIEINWHGISC